MVGSACGGVPQTAPLCPGNGNEVAPLSAFGTGVVGEDAAHSHRRRLGGRVRAGHGNGCLYTEMTEHAPPT
jgi:hypothetical protein